MSLVSWLKGSRALHRSEHGALGLLLPKAARNTVAIIGDSIAESAFDTGYPGTITDNGNGTATIAVSNTENLRVGETISVRGAASAYLNQNAVVASAVVTNTSVTFPVTGSNYCNRLIGGSSAYLLHHNRGSWNSFWDFTQLFCDFRLSLVGMYAAGGSRISDALADLRRCVLGMSTLPQYVVVCVGTNSIYNDADSLATCQGYMRSIITEAVAAGVIPIVLTVPPRAASTYSSVSARREVAHQFNRWLMLYGPSQGAYVINTSDAVIGTQRYADPASATSDPTSGWCYDGVHPNSQGAQGIGKLLGALFSSLVPLSAAFPLCDTYSDIVSAGSEWARNIHPNPKLTGTGGTVTAGGATVSGTAPDGVNVTITSGTGATVTLSQIARTVANDGDDYGNWFRINVTGAPNNMRLVVSLVPTTSSVKNLVNGYSIQSGFLSRLSSGSTPGSGNPANVGQLKVAHSVGYDGSNYFVGNLLDGLQTSPGAFAEGWTQRRIVTRASPVAGGALFGFDGADMYFNAAAGHMTFDIARPTCWRALSAA